MKPSLASFRKQIRHMSNFRRYPRGRPQILQRFTCLVMYFGFASAFSIIAFLAIRILSYFLNGMPSLPRRLFASLSVRALVTMATFMPITFAILS